MGELIYVDEEEPHTDVDFAFEWRDVQVREDQWVTDEYEIFEVLGRGKFGEVKRCTNRANQMSFAAKFIATPTVQDREEVRHELTITKRLQHRRLLQVYDAFSIGTNMCLVLEVILGGELFDRVICEDFVLTEKACVCIMRQVCDGVSYMHRNNIIHLDMKPENILCLTRSGNRIKIIDFGLAREYDPKKDMRVLFGTPEFMAPEVVNYDPISFATDMWSIGVITYVLLSGLSPFMGDCDADTLTNVIKCDYDFNYDDFDDISEAAQDFIEKLLLSDKKKRMTADDCLEHPWLKVSEEQKPGACAGEMSKEQLRHYVYRRKWQKAIYAIIALRRMGWDLQKLSSSALKPALPPKPRVVNIGQFFNKGKENFTRRDHAFNAMLRHCNKTEQRHVIGKVTPGQGKVKPGEVKVKPGDANTLIPSNVAVNQATHNNADLSKNMPTHVDIPKIKPGNLDLNNFKPNNLDMKKVKPNNLDMNKIKPNTLDMNKIKPNNLDMNKLKSNLQKENAKSKPKLAPKSNNAAVPGKKKAPSENIKTANEVKNQANEFLQGKQDKIRGSGETVESDVRTAVTLSVPVREAVTHNAKNNSQTTHSNLNQTVKLCDPGDIAMVIDSDDLTPANPGVPSNNAAQTLNCRCLNNGTSKQCVCKTDNENAPVAMDTSNHGNERRSVVHKRTSSNASCSSDCSDGARDENLNRVLRKRPNMCSVLDRIRAFESGQNENTKPPIAPREETVDISNLKRTGQNARKWQKGNDRYIVVNKIQDTLKFFTVDDQRELISSGFSRSRENSPNIMAS